MSEFSVFTMDGRSSSFDGEPAAFIVMWKEAALDNEKQWPHAFLKNEQNEAEVVHFNPLTITAVSTRVGR
jgi:hypothetical protein